MTRNLSIWKSVSIDLYWSYFRILLFIHGFTDRQDHWAILSVFWGRIINRYSWCWCRSYGFRLYNSRVDVAKPTPRKRSRCADFILHDHVWSIVRFPRSEEHTSELQSRGHLVCRLL